jgi:multisubunit Na+/H+ antiporter MnhE subunit
MRSLAAASLGFVLAAAFYMVLIDTVDLPELYAAIAAVLLGGAACGAARHQGVAEAELSWRWMARAPRVLVSVPQQIVWVSWEVVVQLLHPRTRRGTFRAVAFRAGGEGADDVGRRALAEGMGSVAPNTIVIGIDPQSGLLLVHQLRHAGGRDQIDVLQLG